MTKKVAVFIDASNLWDVQKTRGKMLDFEKLIDYLKDRYKTSSMQVYYYTAFPADGTRSYDTSRKHKFFTYLEKGLGIIINKKELKRISSTTSRFEDGFVEKGNMDVELVIDAVHFVKDYDSAILFTGDSDFLGLVKYIRSRGKKVYIYSSKNSVSSELRTGGDGYIDLLSIDGSIWGREIFYRDQKKR